MSNERQKPRQRGDSEGPGFRLITLGSCRLEGPAGMLPGGLGSGRPLALLSFLALHKRRAVSRDELADLLWWDRDIKAARRVLRQALYVIRKGIGDSALIIEGDLVRFGGGLSFDVLDFEAAVRQGDLEVALRLYGGRFLDGFQLASDGEFGHWVEGERARLHRMFREVASECATRATKAGAWGDALACLDHVLGLSRKQDLTVRCRRIEVLELAGRHVEALAEATQVLEHQEALAIPEWAQSVLRGVTEATSPAQDPAADAHEGLARPSFAGRQAEFQSLLQQWHLAAASDGKVALVVGDPGIGKSRLIEEVVRVARHEGATALEGKSYELEDGLLFGALVDVMAQAIRAPGFAGVSAVWLTELTRLLPELVEHYPELETGGDVETGPGRRRFHEAVAQVFDALAFEAPVICVLDDLHWADEATLELVHYLARRLCAAPVLIVAALRPREASDTLRRLQHILEEEHGGAHIELGPLDRAASDEIIGSMAHGHTPPGVVSERVWETATGNPFLTVSMVGALLESGAVMADPEGWALAAGDGPAHRLPEPWVLIKNRLSDLPDRTHELLELAAIVGRSFDSRMLAEASGEDPASALIHLEALEQKKILKADRTNGAVTFDFTHDRLREAVYEGISEARRAKLHAMAAQALAGSEGLNDCILARHHHQAGQQDEAYRHALAGAEWARGVFAYGGELEMLELARENVPGKSDRFEIDDRIDALLAAKARTDSLSNGTEKKPTWPRWAAGVAVTLVVAMGGWMSFTGLAGAAAPPPLPPLPEGLLVWIEQGDSSGYAIVDPTRPMQHPRIVGPDELSLPPGVLQGSLRFSPDLSMVAFNVEDGDPPDVWTQRRDGLALARITVDPEDDVPLDWLADGSGILVRTLRQGIRADYGGSLVIVRPGGDSLQVLTEGPQDDSGATISPDGSQILLARELDDISIWVMDLDGTDARPLLTGLGSAVHARWSPDGTRAAFFRSVAAGGQLEVFNLSDPQGTLTAIASGIGAGFAWSPDGSRLFFQREVDGNREVFSAPADGGDATRLTFTDGHELVLSFIAPRSEHVETVEILNVGPSGLHLLTGDTVPLRAVAWSADGGLVEADALTVRCLDAAVCEVDESYRITATGTGTTFVIADLGGWRADTTAVEVSNGEPVRLLEEAWESGIDPDRWNSVGDPAPEAVRGIGRDGSSGFVSNGDVKYSSGVSSARGFPWTEGLTLEAWGRGDFDQPGWPAYQDFTLGFSYSPNPPNSRDGGIGAEWALSIGRSHQSVPVQLLVNRLVMPLSDQWDPSQWHHYALQYLPAGTCEAWMDGQLLSRQPCPRPPSTLLWVVLRGRAYEAPVVHDDVTVWSGIRWRSDSATGPDVPR